MRLTYREFLDKLATLGPWTLQDECIRARREVGKPGEEEYAVYEVCPWLAVKELVPAPSKYNPFPRLTIEDANGDVMEGAHVWRAADAWRGTESPEAALSWGKLGYDGHDTEMRRELLEACGLLSREP